MVHARRWTRWFVALSVLIIGAFSLVPSAAAQVNSPLTRPVELVVPYGAGGGNDLTARAFAAVAPDYLGQPVIIRVRPGAGTVIGLSEVARARPDGHTLGWPGPHAIVMSAFEDVAFDFFAQLEPIGQIVDWQWFFVVDAKNSPFHTLEEFLEYARAHPGELVVANSGNLGVGHLPILQLEHLAGVEFTHLPFDGGGPANAAVLSGTADAVAAVTPAALPRIQAGDFRALAVTGSKRHPDAPDVPTFAELGYEILTGNNVGLVAPKGTPQHIIEFLEDALAKIAQDPTFNTLLARMGDYVAYKNREEYLATLLRYKQDAEAMAAVLREAGLIY